MKDSVPLKTVIARRVLSRSDTNRRVRISIGLPQYIGDGWDWVCPYKITGLGRTIHEHVHGIDALQTLQLVTVGIRKTLEEKGLPLRWLDDSYWQSGFPRPLHHLEDPALGRHLETLIVDETTRWVDAKKQRAGRAGRTKRSTRPPRAAGC